MKQLYFIILISMVSCRQPTNREIALEFKEMEVTGLTQEYKSFLADNVIGVFADSEDTMRLNDLILNQKFNKKYNPWFKVTSISEPNDTTVELEVLETNQLLELFNIDTIGYLYRYTISESKITRIEMDIILDSDYMYQETDSLYRSKLVELYDWISLNYPENYELINQMDVKSAEIIIEMAKERYGR